MEIVEKILNEVKNLNPIEKIKLIEAILESFDNADKDIEKKWIREAEARYEAYKNGKLKTTDWEEIAKRYK
ncbi:MAG: addiction module protein [Calditrichaeota bacterium]|nr:addiction module protein [Calditrichota bacterium]